MRLREEEELYRMAIYKDYVLYRGLPLRHCEAVERLAKESLNISQTWMVDKCEWNSAVSDINRIVKSEQAKKRKAEREVEALREKCSHYEGSRGIAW